MAKKIEIFENTLLKLLVRRGTDVDRKNIILSEGELGYTIDTKKLYVGDGQTVGGVPAGGISFLGTYNQANNQVSTSFNGDLIFSQGGNKLYTYVGPNWKEESAWKAIGGLYTAGNGSIVVDEQTNTISVGLLSANDVSTDALGAGMALDTSKRVTLSSAITIDKITTRNFDSITLPAKINHTFPTGSSVSRVYTLPTEQESGVLYTGIDGTLSWQPYNVGSHTLFVNGSAVVPVGTILAYPTNTNVPYGWVKCDGQVVNKNDYPDLEFILYGGTSGPQFRVPDLTDKSIYGTLDPTTSVVYTTVSGESSSLPLSPLSAIGMIYIIKARPDDVVSSDMIVNYPIVANLNGSDQGQEVFSTLGNTVKLEFDTSGPIGFRNKVINGNFDFWQRRNETFNIPVSNVPVYYPDGSVTRTMVTADRWTTVVVGDLQRGRFSVRRMYTSPDNFPVEDPEDDFFLPGTNYLSLTYDTNVGVPVDGTTLYDSLCESRGILCAQNIEDAATMLGKTLTLSFWARTTRETPTKIYCGHNIRTGDSSLTTPGIFSELFELNKDWQFFQHTFTLPTYHQVSAVGYSTATIPRSFGKIPERPDYTALSLTNSLPALSSWLLHTSIRTHSSRGHLALFGHSISATVDGYAYYLPGSGAPINYPANCMTMDTLSTLCVNMLSGETASSYEIAQIQLEVGKGASPFEHRPKQTELALCQRYFEKSYDVNMPVGTAGLLVSNTTRYFLLSTKNILHESPLFAGGTSWSMRFDRPFKVTKARYPFTMLYSPRTGLSGAFSYDIAPTAPIDLRFGRQASTNSAGLSNVAISDTNGWHTGAIQSAIKAEGGSQTLGFVGCYTMYAADAEINYIP